MALTPSSSAPYGIPVSIICSVCTDPLLKGNVSGQVVTLCGHVFHKKCLTDWYRSQDIYCCPKCRNTTEKDSSSQVYLDAEQDSDYLAILKMVECLHKEKAEALEGLRQLRLSLDKETEKLNRVRHENGDVVKYASSLHLENAHLKKQMTVAKIKEILLGPNKQLLDDQFGQLKWDDLTVSFQKELLDKMSPRCHTVLKLVPLRSETWILHLIKSDPNEILLKLIEEYFDHQLQLKGTVTWNDFTKLFNQDLLLRLSKKCGIWNEHYECPNLKLNQLPMTPKIIVTLMKDEEEDTHSGVTLLATIVELFIENVSDVHIKNIFKILLMKLITDKIPDQLELRFPFVNDQDELLELVRLGILKETTNFDFVYDSVEYFFLEMLRRRMEAVNCMNRTTGNGLNGIPNYGTLKMYFFNYFVNQPSDRSIYLTNLIDFNEDEFSDLLMIFAVMSADRSIKDVHTYMDTAIANHEYEKKRREWTCKIKSSPITLTLIHFAAIRGDYVTVKSLLYDHDFFRELYHPRNEKLVQVCVLETSNNSSMEILERKLILTSILKHVYVVALSHSSIRLTNVHIDLLKFLLELGERFLWKVLGKDQILLEAAEYLKPDEFHDLVQLVVEGCNWKILKRRDDTGATALDLAMRRINVNPETIKIFLDYGITLKDQDS